MSIILLRAKHALAVLTALMEIDGDSVSTTLVVKQCYETGLR